MESEANLSFVEQSPGERQIPANLDSERAVLGNLLLAPSLLPEVARLVGPEEFHLDSHRRIFYRMDDLAKSDSGFDLSLLIQELQKTGDLEAVGGVGYVSSLIDGVPVGIDLKAHCQRVRDTASMRTVYHAAVAVELAATDPRSCPQTCRLQFDRMQQLLAHSSRNRLRACSFDELLTDPLPPREMILDPIIPRQGLMILYSKRGVGKTYFSLGMALAVSSGTSFLRWSAPKPRRVLFVDGEMPGRVLQERIAAVERGLPQCELRTAHRELLHFITPDLQDSPMPDLATREGQSMIEDELGQAEMLVLDNLSALCRSGKENEGESWLHRSGC